MIHIMGVDGVGKSTVLNEIEKQGLKVLRCPQFDLSTEAKRLLPLRYFNLAQYFEKMSLWCDQNRRPDIKAWALFYAMGLYKKIVDEVQEEYQFAERYPFYDVQIYSPIYISLLKNVSTENLKGIDFQMTAELQSYLHEMTGSKDILSSFHFIYDQLSQPDSKKWKEDFPAFPSHHLVLLYADISTVLQRLSKKAGSQAGEFHEKAQYLMQIQKGYQNFLKAVPEDRQLVINVDQLQVKELSQTLCQQWQKWK